MTNPDNVGGLPELPEPTGWMCIDNYRAKIEFTNLQHVADEWMQDKRLIVSAVNTADQMRAYGELCRAAPAGGEPNGKLVGWWNGITPGFDGMGMPSIRWGADAEDSRHDIPLYDGYNPIHYVTPVSASAGGDSLRALVKELRESLEGVVRVADRNTDEFDRAREAIARASHVFVNAGDSEAQFIADGENLDCPACGGSGHAGDSAPAGSGEVERLKTTIDHYERGLISTPYTRAIVDQVRAREMAYHLEVVRLNRVVARQSAKIKRLATLLRKLANGGEQCRDASVSTDNEFIGEAMGRLADEVEKPGSKVTITKADACAIGIYVRALSRGVPEGE